MSYSDLLANDVLVVKVVENSNPSRHKGASE